MHMLKFHARFTQLKQLPSSFPLLPPLILGLLLPLLSIKSSYLLAKYFPALLRRYRLDSLSL